MTLKITFYVTSNVAVYKYEGNMCANNHPKFKPNLIWSILFGQDDVTFVFKETHDANMTKNNKVIMFYYFADSCNISNV